MPTVPAKRELMKFLQRKGYWVVHPRWPGSWESGGFFLKHSPDFDVLSVLDQLPRGFTDSWSGRRYRVKAKEIVLLGGSFGGPAVLLASRDKRVTAAVAYAPVVDWSAPSRDEPLPWLYRYVQRAFGQAYRISPRDWSKLGRGSFYNPSRHSGTFDSDKILVFHAKDDRSVSYRSVKKFCQLEGIRLIPRKVGGHISYTDAMTPYDWKMISAFLKAVRTRI
jgi:alpha-beta hydrolase superfamily lysophospholipase